MNKSEEVLNAIKNVLEDNIKRYRLKIKDDKNEFSYCNGCLDMCLVIKNSIDKHEQLADFNERLSKL